MKIIKYLLILRIFLLTTNINCQQLTFSQKFGGNGDNRSYKTVVDNNNNNYILGFYTGTVHANVDYPTFGTGQDVFIIKYDSGGNLIWFKQIGSNNQDDYADAITLSPDGLSVLITGGFNGSICNFGEGYTLSNATPGTSDAFLLSLKTSDGSVNNVKNIAYGDGWQRTQDIKFDKNSNIVILGYVQANTFTTYFSQTESFVCNGIQNYFILQLDPNYEINWFKQITGDSNNNKLFSLDIDENGYYIAGTNRNTLNLDVHTLNSIDGSPDMFLYKTDFSGNGQWIRSIKGSGSDVSVYSTCDQQGHIYISGYYASSDLKVDSTATLQSARSVPNKGSNDIFFAKYTTDGTLQWFDIAGSTGDDRVTRLCAEGENIVIAGQFGGPMTFNNETLTPEGGTDALSIVHDKNDNLLYAIKAGGSGDDVTQSCAIDNEGNFIFTGNFFSPTLKFDTDASHDLTNSVSNKSTRDVFIAKYKSRSITLNPVSVKCAGTYTGSIAANPKGAWVGDKTYLWSKDGDAAFTATTSSITNLSSGTYHCKVTDDLNNETASITLTDPAPVLVSEKLSSHKEAKCYGSSDGALEAQTSGGALPLTYVWSGTGSGIIASNTNQNNLTAGTYSVTVTDNNGCSATAGNMIITHPSKINFKNTTITKINGSLGAVNLDIQGGIPAFSYSWTGPSAFSASIEDISGLTIAGNYIVTVTDQNTCTADTSVLIVDSNNLYASLTQKKEVGCFGESDGSLTVTAETNDLNPVFSYAWTGPNGFTATSASITGLEAGTYSVTVTDSNPDPDKTYTISGIVIKQPAAALSVLTTKVNPACNGSVNGIVDSNVSGGTLPYTYQWKKDGNTIPDNMEVIYDKGQGVYEVSVLDANNCPASISTTLTDPAPITLNTALVTPVSCIGTKNDGAIALNITGGTGASTFLWSNGLTSANISLLSAGSYTCTITDVNNCSFVTTQTVGQPSPITASFNNTNVTCFGGSTGAIDMTPSGGNAGGYTYLWSNNSTNEDLTNLVLGSYSVKIKDSRNCEKTLTTSITEPADLNVTASLIQNVSCNGTADGSVSLNTTGGTPSYNWVWSNSQTGPVATNLVAATYSVTVTDGNSCSKNTSFQITEPTALSISEVAASHTDVTCNGAFSGTLEVTASGSSGSYQYSVDGNTWQSSGLFSSISAGIYPVMVRDQGVISCSKTLTPSISISEPTAIAFSSAVVNDITCSGFANGSINAIATGGIGLLSYKLKLNGVETNNVTGASSGNFNGLNAGASYTVEVTDANSCGPITSAEINITEPSSIAITNATAADITCFGLSNGAINVSANGGTGALAYKLLLNGTAWANNSGATSGNFTGLSAGTGYNVEVTDANNCSPVASSTLNITEPIQISISSELATKTSGSGLSDGTVNVVAVGGTGILSFSLNGISQPVGLFEGLAKGTYLVNITDANNCGPASSSSLIVDEPTSVGFITEQIVSLYPNPSSEKVYIEIRNTDYKDLKVEIKNITGQAALTQKFENVCSGNVLYVNLDQLPKGIYVVILNHNILKDKLIIQ